MKNYSILLPILLITVGLSACSEPDSTTDKTATVDAKLERWYSLEHVKAGKPLFQQHCAVCHGQQAQGVTHPWNKPLADGSYPPPPLNGTAHAWHHPLKALVFTISKGGKPVGGAMPSFEDKLTLEQQASIVAYFQSYWSDTIYQAWLNRGGFK